MLYLFGRQTQEALWLAFLSREDVGLSYGEQVKRNTLMTNSKREKTPGPQLVVAYIILSAQRKGHFVEGSSPEYHRPNICRFRVRDLHFPTLSSCMYLKKIRFTCDTCDTCDSITQAQRQSIGILPAISKHSTHNLHDPEFDIKPSRYIQYIYSRAECLTHVQTPLIHKTPPKD